MTINWTVSTETSVWLSQAWFDCKDHFNILFFSPGPQGFLPCMFQTFPSTTTPESNAARHPALQRPGNEAPIWISGGGKHLKLWGPGLKNTALSLKIKVFMTLNSWVSLKNVDWQHSCARLQKCFHFGLQCNTENSDVCSRRQNMTSLRYFRGRTVPVITHQSFVGKTGTPWQRSRCHLVWNFTIKAWKSSFEG